MTTRQILLFYREEQLRQRRHRAALVGDTNAAFVGGTAAEKHLKNLQAEG